MDYLPIILKTGRPPLEALRGSGSRERAICPRERIFAHLDEQGHLRLSLLPSLLPSSPPSPLPDLLPPCSGVVIRSLSHSLLLSASHSFIFRSHRHLRPRAYPLCPPSSFPLLSLSYLAREGTGKSEVVGHPKPTSEVTLRLTLAFPSLPLILLPLVPHSLPSSLSPLLFLPLPIPSLFPHTLSYSSPSSLFSLLPLLPPPSSPS